MGDTQSENGESAQQQMSPPQRMDLREPPRAPAKAGHAPLSRSSTARSGWVIRTLLPVVAVLVISGLVGVTAVKAVNKLRPTSPGASTQSVRRLNPIGDGLKCVEQVAWSPDGTHIAVLGDTHACGGTALDQQTTQLFIYDVRNGEITQRLAPDIDVLEDENMGGSIYVLWKDPHAEPQLSYSNLVWTPDGAALLLPFSIRITDPQRSTTAYVKGLLREGVSDKKLTTVWIDNTPVVPSGEVEVWDLTGSIPILVQAPPAAAAYRWNGDGSISAMSSAATGPVGLSDGGDSFTIWQPGSLNYTAPPSGGSINAQDVGWTTAIAPISPDGRYFYESLDVSGSLVPPSTAQAQPLESKYTPHDKALQALAQQLTQAATPDAASGQLVAWRPDGGMLATVSQQPQSTEASGFTVSIYNTATGQLIKRLTPDFTGLHVGLTQDEALAWSPDGTRLLLADSAYGAITIWGPGALPA